LCDLDKNHLTFAKCSFYDLKGTTTPLNVNDLIVCQSDRRGFAGLKVAIFDLPADAPLAVIPCVEGYWFAYRPRAEKGDSRVIVPEYSLAHHRVSRDNVPMYPPNVLVRTEWQNAAGGVVQFIFDSRFLEDMANKLGVSFARLYRPSLPFFSINHQIEALGRLLMEETENQCRTSPLYFESLAPALAISVLRAICDDHRRKARALAVPPGIRRAIERLEADFADDISLAQLADLAQLGRSHFASKFRQATGETPHQYLLRVRLSHARKLMAQGDQAMSLAEIAAACGFFDQAHLGRQFRRFFGTTLAAFRGQDRA
jgi:AraC-like DNA-binding protein